MADDAVARLDFATNIATVTSEVTQALQQLQTQLESAGSRAGTKGQVGAQFTEGLQKIIGNVTEMGNTIQQQVTRSIDGLAKLSDFKGPTTLGGQFGGLIKELQDASAAYAKALDPVASRQLGGQANVQAQTRQQLIAPIQALISQLREVQQIVNERIAAMTGEQRAAFERFANPAQIGRAVGIGVSAGAVDSSSVVGGGIVAATDAAAKARQREATAAAAAAQAEEDYAQELRNLKVYLDEEIAAGRARRFANDNVNVDAPAGRVQYRYPSQLDTGEAPDVAGATETAAQQADVRRAEEAAYQAQERFLAQQEKDSLTLTRQQQGVNRAHQQAIDTEATWADQTLQAARFAAYQSGSEGYARLGAKSPYFATPEGPAKLTGAGLDTGLNTKEMDAAAAAYAKSTLRSTDAMDEAFASFQQVKVANEGLARSDELYSALIAKEGLGGLAAANPGTRDLAGPYFQLGEILLKQGTSGLQVVQGNEEVYRASQALASRLVQEARLAQGGTSGGASVDPRRGSVFDSFLGGAFGHGFDTSQAFDPSLAIGNLAATAGVLARYGYEFKLIQGVLNSIKTSFTDLGAYQENMVTLGEAIASTGTSSLDLGQAIGGATEVALNQNDAIAIGTQGLQAYRDELQQGVSANTIFTRSVEDVGTAMLLSGQDAQTAQKNLIAATNSFQLGSGGGSRINDAVVNAVKNYGGNRADVYDALATAGGAAQEAGLTPEQLSNLVALIESRTGDSGSTVASSINRLVSRQDNAQFRGALGQLGIADTGQVGSEIIALSKAYNGLTTAQQQSLIVSLGGARALKDLLPVLQDGASLTDANKRSTEGAGAASQAAAAQLATMSGQLKELRAIFTDILTNVGRAGIFGGLEAAIAVIKPALEAVNTLLSAFDGAVPGLGRGVLGVVVDFALLGQTIIVFRQKMEKKSAVQVLDSETTAANTKATLDNNAAQLAGAEATGAANAASTERVAALDAESLATANQTRLLLERNAAISEVGLLGAAGLLTLPTAAETAGPGIFARGYSAVKGLPERGGFIGAASTGAASALGLLTNPVTIAIGALVAFGGVTDSMHRLDKATQDGTDALNSLATAGKRAGSNTSVDLATAAADFKNAAKEAKASGGGFFGTITNFFDGNQAGKAAASDLAQARFASSQSALIGNSLSDVSNLANTAFGPETTLAQGLQAMKDRGIDAGTQLQAVSIALGLVKDNANSAAGALLDLGPSGTRSPTGTPENILALAQAVGKPSVDYTVNPGSDSQFRASTGYSIADADKIITAQLKKDKVGPGEALTDAEIGRLQQALISNYKASSGATPAAQAAFIKKLVTALANGFKDLTTKAIAQGGFLNDTTLQSDLTLLLPTQAQAVQDANPLRLGSKQSALQRNLNQLNALKAKASDPSGDAFRQTLIAIAAAEDALAQEKVKNLEALRVAAEASAGGNIAAIKGLRRDYFAKEIADAGNDEGVLVGIFNQMTQGEIDLFRAKYQQEVQLARAALASEQALLAAVDSLSSNDIASVKREIVASRGVGAAEARLKTLLDLLNSFNSAGKSAVPQTSTSADNAVAAAQQAHLAEINSTADPRNPLQQAETALKAAQYQKSIATKGTADYYNALKAVTDAEYALAQAHVQLSDAIAQAQVYPGSKIEAAAAELRTATNEMKLAEPGTVDWYKAQGDELKARLDYAAAVQENAHVLRELHGDPTDPVFQAAEALRQAKEQLRTDQANNAPQDVLNADREKIKEASEAKQRAAFDQKFSDEKTAFDLQQISATTYIKFLDHQRDVLQNIHHRTRQQIDELNQVDEAIKGLAGQLDGQFNLGDIKIPTPYEARRYIQATSQGQGYQSTAVTNTTNTVNISGADTHKVKAILKQLLGPPSIGRTSTGTRKT